jgi:hypothetical protein
MDTSEEHSWQPSCASNSLNAAHISKIWLQKGYRFATAFHKKTGKGYSSILKIYPYVIKKAYLTVQALLLGHRVKDGRNTQR